MDVTKTRNINTFDKGIRIAKDKIKRLILDKLKKVAEDLILDAEFAQGYNNLTGNTLTSYAVGIYYQYKLEEYIDIFEVDSGIDKPTSPKLTTGNGWVSVTHYDTGERVSVNRRTLDRTDEDYGFNTSREFLYDYTPDNGGFVIVMCTGTEYSAVLEHGGLNVLTDTFQFSPRAFLSNLRKIKYE